MPFKSVAQRGYMFVHHPEIAKRWAREYGGGGPDLPEHADAKEEMRRARLRKAKNGGR